jgi:DNA-binding NtrC family response regulator
VSDEVRSDGGAVTGGRDGAGPAAAAPDGPAATTRGAAAAPPPLKVLVVDDERLIRWSLREALEQEGYQVLEAGSAEEGLGLCDAEHPDIVFLDVRLPGMSGLEALRRLRTVDDTCAVIMMTAYATVEEAVEALKQGAQEFLKKPFDLCEVRALLLKVASARRLRRDLERLRREAAQQGAFIGTSAAVRKLLELAASVRDSDTTVLVDGESGTGKGLLARVIHEMSARAKGPLVEVNCSAVPPGLFESELLGYERGAFTDARTAKRGLLELADGGTLVLDEIGEIPLPVQAKLLRCIEEKRFHRVGGLRDLEVDVRVVATTNRDLEQAVAAGKFRADLFFRLNVFPLHLPPLRARRDDIAALARHFVERMNRQLSKSVKGVSPEALRLMLAYDWPGNARELRNVIERGVLLATGDELLPVHLPAELQAAPAGAASPAEGPGAGVVPLAAAERRLIEEALARAGGNQTGAARMLGVTRDTLRYRMKKHGLG